MRVDGVRTPMQAEQHLRPAGDLHDQAHGRPDRVAATDPIFEDQTLLRRNTPGSGAFRCGGDRHKVSMQSRLWQPGATEPIASARCVGQRLLRAKGLGTNDEECRCGVAGCECVGERARIEVADALAGRSIGLCRQYIERQRRAEVGSADAEVDHVAHGFPGGEFPLAVAYLTGDARLRRPTGLDPGAQVMAAQHDWAMAAQRGVQGRAALGRVDHIAALHANEARLHTGLFRQFAQQIEPTGIDAVPREVGAQQAGVDLEPAGLASQSGHRGVAASPGYPAMGIELLPGRKGVGAWHEQSVTMRRCDRRQQQRAGCAWLHYGDPMEACNEKDRSGDQAVQAR